MENEELVTRIKLMQDNTKNISSQIYDKVKYWINNAITLNDILFYEKKSEKKTFDIAIYEFIFKFISNKETNILTDQSPNQYLNKSVLETLEEIKLKFGTLQHQFFLIDNKYYQQIVKNYAKFGIDFSKIKNNIVTLNEDGQKYTFQLLVSRNNRLLKKNTSELNIASIKEIIKIDLLSGINDNAIYNFLPTKIE